MWQRRLNQCKIYGFNYCLRCIKQFGYCTIPIVIVFPHIDMIVAFDISNRMKQKWRH